MKNIENKSGLFIGSGVLAGFLTSLCCVGPLILTLLGVSGAAVLAKFHVLHLPLTVAVVGIFSVSGYNLYRKRKSCEPGSICADPRKYRAMTILYWIGLMIAVLAVTSPYWVGWIFG
ncbi:MAG: mercury transporter [Deltaproteobacteria bacterium]|nr:mercury transporter [Deltaproteobacteria bacterium]